MPFFVSRDSFVYRRPNIFLYFLVRDDQRQIAISNCLIEWLLGRRRCFLSVNLRAKAVLIRIGPYHEALGVIYGMV